jgi:hypothetical protein
LLCWKVLVHAVLLSLNTDLQLTLLWRGPYESVEAARSMRLSLPNSRTRTLCNCIFSSTEHDVHVNV